MPRMIAAESRGAGDSMTAGVAAVLAQGGTLCDAVRTGAAAGALNVTRHGLGHGPHRRGPGAHRAGTAHPRRHEGARMTPRILITNDDGIDAPGIRWLARAAARQGHDVVVAAPMTEASGTSAAMTAVEKHGKIIVAASASCRGRRTSPRTRSRPPRRSSSCWPCGKPSAPPPDIVLSGINRGANAGAAVVHSGTVGATLTGLARGPARPGGLPGRALPRPTAPRRSGGQAIADLDKADDENRHWAQRGRAGGEAPADPDPHPARHGPQPERARTCTWTASAACAGPGWPSSARCR